MSRRARLIEAAAAMVVFGVTILGHVVTIRLPYHEDIFEPLQRQLGWGSALALAIAAAVWGPRYWRHWLWPVAQRFPVRTLLFAIVFVWAMWLPARQGNLTYDFPMMLLLFCKLAAGLWLALALTGLWAAVVRSLSHPPESSGTLTDPDAWWSRLQDFAQSRWAPWAAGAVAGLIALAANWHLWDGIIRIPDEASYWIQGAMLAQGRLWLPAAPWAEAFVSEFNVLDGGRWYGAYPPGWPVLLALGWFVGAPSIVNPLLTAAIAGLGVALARRHFAAWLAGPAWLMAAFSPWLWEEGMTFLSHSATLFAFMLGLAFLARWLKRPDPAQAFAAALAFGWIVLTRQLDAVCLFGALGVWLVFLLREISWRHRLVMLGALGASGALFGGLHLAYNAALTGHPLYFPLKRYYDLLMGEQWFRYGFGPDIGDLSGYCYALGHTPFEGFWNAWVNVTVINGDFLGWPGGSLALFWVWLFWGRKDALGRLLLALAAALFGAYFFWWYHGLLTGSRYYFLLWILALWGTLGGLETLAALGAETLKRPAALMRRGGIRFVVASTALALLCYYPILWLEYYPGFFGIEREPWDRIEREVNKPALVFVEGEGFSRFAAPYCLNAVPPGGGVVWAKSGEPERDAAVIAAFPGRSVYLLEEYRIHAYERPVDHP